MCSRIIIILSHGISHQIIENSYFWFAIILFQGNRCRCRTLTYSCRDELHLMNMCPSYMDYSQLVYFRLHFCSFLWDKEKCLILLILADIWKNPLVVVGAETPSIPLMHFHCDSFRNALTNLSYMLSFGVNFGIHGTNLLTKTPPASAALALWMSSSSLFSCMLSWSCMGTNILSSSSSKTLYLFNGMIAFISYTTYTQLTIYIFVFTVVPSVSDAENRNYFTN